MSDCEVAMFHRCRQCGQQFYVGVGIEKWTYKAGLPDSNTAWFCGWNCYSKWIKEHKTKYKDEKPVCEGLPEQGNKMP